MFQNTKRCSYNVSGKHFSLITGYRIYFSCLAHLAVNHLCVMIHALAWYHAIAYSDHCQSTVTLQEKNTLCSHTHPAIQAECALLRRGHLSLHLRVAAADGRSISAVSSQGRPDKGWRQWEAFSCGCLSHCKRASNKELSPSEHSTGLIVVWALSLNMSWRVFCAHVGVMHRCSAHPSNSP